MPLIFQTSVVTGKASMNRKGNAHRARKRSILVGLCGRLSMMTIAPIQYAAIVIAHIWNVWPKSVMREVSRHIAIWKIRETFIAFQYFPDNFIYL